MALAGCVGSIDGQAFEREVQARGGGLDGELVLDALEAVEDELGTDDVRLRSLDVRPGYVTLEVQVPHAPDELDAYRYGSSGRYGGRGLGEARPVPRNAAEPPLAEQLFSPAEAGLGDLDAVVDEALAAAEVRGGYTSDASVRRVPGGAGPVITVTVTNERRTVVVTFAADGSLVEVVAR